MLPQDRRIIAAPSASASTIGSATASRMDFDKLNDLIRFIRAPGLPYPRR